MYIYMYMYVPVIGSVRGSSERFWQIFWQKKIGRKKIGHNSSSARKMQLYHQWWLEFPDKWAEKTISAEVLPWADGESRMSQTYFNWIVGWSARISQIHRWKLSHSCKAPRNRYLPTDHFDCKTVKQWLWPEKMFRKLLKVQICR